MSAKIIPFLTHRANDLSCELVDLNRKLITNPGTTFGLTACGDSMMDDGIENADLLIVDRSFAPRDGDVVITVPAGNFTMKP